MSISARSNRVQTIDSTLARTFWSSETAVMTMLAVLVGISAGLGVVIFRRLLDGLFEWGILGWGSAFPKPDFTQRQRRRTHRRG